MSTARPVSRRGRLRFAGIRNSKRRVLRLTSERLQVPGRVGRPHGPKAHDATIRTERVDQIWGIDLLRYDHGSQFVADDFRRELAFLGITPSPAFVRKPEGHVSGWLEPSEPWLARRHGISSAFRSRHMGNVGLSSPFHVVALLGSGWPREASHS